MYLLRAGFGPFFPAQIGVLGGSWSFQGPEDSRAWSHPCPGGPQRTPPTIVAPAVQTLAGNIIS